MSTFAKFLRDVLVDGKSQDEVYHSINSAMESNISSANFSNWCRGTHLPSKKNIDIIARYMKQIGQSEADLLSAYKKSIINRKKISNISGECGEITINSEGFISEEFPIGPLKLGYLTTNWIDKQGKGLEVFDRSNVQIRLVDEMVNLPEKYSDVLRIVELEAESDRLNGKRSIANGDLLTLSSVEIGRSENDEFFLTSLEFKRSKYFSFFASKISPDGKVLMKEDLADWSIDQPPIEHLSTGFGCAILVFTKDNYVIFTKRSNVRVRENEFDVSVVEGMHALNDTQNFTKVPDLWDFCARGIEQEIGIKVQSTDIKIVSIGVDIEYYQWNILGYLDSSFTKNELMAEINRKAKDACYEFSKFIAVKAIPREILTYVKNNKMWSCGIATVVYSLCNKYGQGSIFKLCDEIFE